MWYDAYNNKERIMKTYIARIILKGKGSFQTSVQADSEYAARRLIEAQYNDATITSIHEE